MNPLHLFHSSSFSSPSTLSHLSSPSTLSCEKGNDRGQFFTPRQEIDAKNLDLKAVNPHAKSQEDFRTPEELLDLNSGSRLFVKELHSQPRRSDMPRFRNFRNLWFAPALLLFLLFACKAKGPTPKPAAAPPAKPAAPAAAALPEKLTAANLQPSFIVQGIPRRVPDEVVVRFAREVVDQTEVGAEAGPDTVLKITPALEGRAVWRDRQSLVFTPKPAFPNNAGFRFELVQVKTPAGVLRPEPGQAWEIASFTTPGFEVRGVELEKVDFKQNQAWVVLNWTGPVSLPSLTSHTHVYLADKALAKFSFEPQTHWDQVLLKVAIPVLTESKRLKLVLDSGVTTQDGRSQTLFQSAHELTLTEPKRLRITEVQTQEGQNGWYLQVACEDEAVDRSKGYNWQLNLCDLPPDAIRDYVQVNPPVALSTVAVRNGFRIFGDFKRGSYALLIEPGLHSNLSGVLTRAFEQTVNVPRRSPKVSFISKGRYLPASLIANVPVSHLNVGAISLVVRQVPERNLVFWMSGEDEKADDRTSDAIAKKVFKVSAGEDEKKTTWLDLREEVANAGKGVFELNLVGGEVAADGTFTGSGSRDSSRLILTDLALVVKQAGPGGKDLDVWALGIEDNRPRAGVALSLLTMSNRSLAEGQTDSAGMCRLHGVTDPLGDKAPFALIARQGDDLTAVRFADLKVPTGEADVQGPPFRQVNPYQAALYADRGVYRPGETAHLVAIVWGEGNRAPKEGLPVLGRLLDPRKKEVSLLRGATNPAGMVSFDLSFEAYAATGRYELGLEIGGNPVAAHKFNVEEFVPERMKVSLAADRKDYLQSEPVPVKIEAKYLFGALASGEKVELFCSLEEGRFSPEKNGEYHYSTWRNQPFKPLPLGTVTGQLDPQGKTTLACPAVSATAAFRGAGQVKALASVFESGSGRTTVADLTLPVHPAKVYLGLIASAETARPGQELKIEGIIVDWNGNVVTDERKIEIRTALLESDWVYEYDEDSGRETNRRFLREMPLGKELLTARGGKFSYAFTPSGDAEGYLLRANAEGNLTTDLMVPAEGASRWSEEAEEGEYVAVTENTPKPQRPATMPLEAPTELTVGRDATVTVKPPYPGRMLFTVETDRVLESRWMDVEAKPTAIAFKIAEFVPNVYVSALLLKNPRQETEKAFLPGRAFAIKSIPVAPEAHRLTVSVKAPAEVRPNHELAVELQASREEKPLFATVAAVDEGILQLTKYKTPDPLGKLFQKRALGVETFETVGWNLLVPPMAEAKSAGGDEEGAVRGRIPPVKPVALWSGIVKLGEDGKAVVRFQVPQYRGSLKVIVVAVGPSRIGVATTNVTVRDPLTIQTTFPRFLLADDRFVIPVFLTNLTDEPESVEVELQAGDGVSIQGEARKPIALAPNAGGTVTFVAKAVAATGAAQFKVIARGRRNTSEDSARIPFLPSGPVTREVSITKLDPGANDLVPKLVGWNPQYEQTTVWVTGNQYARELSHLKWLIQYPYGCIEQTTSFTRPLLFIADLLGVIDPDSLKNAKIEDKFMFGARRLLSMQTSTGGFSYWPGETAPTFWGTAYATHLLLKGKEAGYPIPEDRLNDALAFMENTLNTGSQQTDAKYGYTVSKSEPYMQYVLALAHRGRKGRIKQLLENPAGDWGELKEENLYLLKAALYLAGDQTYAADLKRPETAVSDQRTNGWCFWSALRTKGMQLDIMEELFPHSVEAEPLAQAIAARLRASANGYLTTQEISWTVSALGRRTASGAKSWSPPKLSRNDKELKPLPRDQAKTKDAVWQLSGASGAGSLNLQVDKIEGGALFAMVTVEGMKPGVPYELGDHTLKVSREYKNAAGEKLAENSLKLGDVVYVDLTLQNLSKEEIQNVALVDRFGAGLEIENPRLNRERALDWTQNLWEVDYLDMRDDRIEFFGLLKPGETVHSVYVLRAVTGGEFTSPPVKAEAMYEPRFWSAAGGGTIRILDPWKAMTD